MKTTSMQIELHAIREDTLQRSCCLVYEKFRIFQSLRAKANASLTKIYKSVQDSFAKILLFSQTFRFFMDFFFLSGRSGNCRLFFVCPQCLI